MAAWSKSVKTIVVALLVLAAVSLIPVLPNAAVRGDPVETSDPRIDADISSADLAQILQLVRGGRLSSAYQRHFVQTQLPLRALSTASSSLLIGPGQPTVTATPTGEIQATFAAGCRPDCQEGITYYFTRRGDSWHITKIRRWVV